MSLQRNRKLVRDQALFQHWEGLSSNAFDKIPLQQLKDAQAALQGHIVLPDNPDYNADRQLFNPVFNAYPVAIVYCAVESDVAIALKLAQDVILPFTVRSGGHCTAGFSAGYGVLIDVSELNEVTIDAAAQVATV